MTTADEQIWMFHAHQNWLSAEFRRLRRLPRTPAVKARLDEILIRQIQVTREITVWMEREQS